MAGRLSHRVCQAISWRTDLVTDREALARIDGAVARAAVTWGPLSDPSSSKPSMWVDRFDPGALRRTRASARSRDLHIGSRDDGDGTTSVWGRLYSTDAAAVDRKLTGWRTVCAGRPANDRPTPCGRSARSRPAPTGWPAGADHQVPAADDDGQGSNVVIHVLAEAGRACRRTRSRHVGIARISFCHRGHDAGRGTGAQPGARTDRRAGHRGRRGPAVSCRHRCWRVDPFGARVRRATARRSPNPATGRPRRWTSSSDCGT